MLACFSTQTADKSLSLATTLSIVTEIFVMCACIFGAVFFAFILALCFYLGMNLAYVLAFAMQNTQILTLINRLPLFKPLTMNSLLSRLGVIDESELDRDFKIISSGDFTIQKSPLFMPTKPYATMFYYY